MILGLLRVVTASIVICTHNRARILARAVDEAVSQARVAGAEVVVVDNASSDDTPALLAERVRPGDVILTLGAGDVNRLAKALVEEGTP